MAKISHTFSGLTNGFTYYGKVYTVNPKERANNRADLAVFAATPSAFPDSPTEYLLIDTYTTSQTWEAPEDGWFKVEVHGASGNGGVAQPSPGNSWVVTVDGISYCFYVSGGGGGGSGYSCSTVKLKKGDTVRLAVGSIGSDTTATVSSSVDPIYSHSLKVTSGGNGSPGTKAYPSYASGGAGGVGSGGNQSNKTGGAGGKGTCDLEEGTSSDRPLAAGGTGGTYAVAGGNVGGKGGEWNGKQYNDGGLVSPASGKAGFIKISRGNTNVL